MIQNTDFRTLRRKERDSNKFDWMWELIQVTDSTTGEIHLMVVPEGERYRHLDTIGLNTHKVKVETLVRDRNRQFLEEIVEKWKEEGR